MVSMCCVVTGHAAKYRLSFAIISMNMTAARTFSTGIFWIYSDKYAARPLHLVFKLSAKLDPTLIQNRLV